MTTRLIGVGLRPPHFPYLESNPDIRVGWFEAISENYMDTEGRPRRMLERVRSQYPVALHGVYMSIASPEGLNQLYLERLGRLVDSIEPFVVSDHLCWTRTHSHSLHDLLPFPYDAESLDVVVRNIHQAQDFLGRQLLVENISAYISFHADYMVETDFISEMVARTGCGLLLDINNLYVNAVNYQFDAWDYYKRLPLWSVKQVHIAGHSVMEKFLFDTHSAPVAPGVWDLVGRMMPQLPRVPVLLEWDEAIPDFETVQTEALKAAIYLKASEVAV